MKMYSEPARDDRLAVACFDLPDLGVPVGTPMPAASETHLSDTKPVATPASPKKHHGTADYFRPRDLALRWGVCVDKVLNFIRSGELRAFNVAAKKSKRPQYRIPLESVRHFEEQTRAAAPPEPPADPAPSRRRKSKSTAPAGRTYF